ncbi:hypothetical protein ES705_20756 [subsurface metagenome]
MEQKEIERLRFRRQYILAPKAIESPFLHEKRNVTKNYILYSHVDLLVTENIKNDLRLFLLGDIFDYEVPQKNNKAILEDLASLDYEHFIEQFSNYAGRYVLLYIYKNKMILLHDTTATRRIYYCRKDDDWWFSSQSHLLAKVLDLTSTKDPDKLNFYNSIQYLEHNNSDVGDSTRYDEIKQVLPNHYFDVNENKTIRFWPDKKIETEPYKEVAEKCAAIVKGYIESIAARYEIMIPVTAGKDSRLLAAASHKIRDKVFYYINKENNLTNQHHDIYIPKKLFKKLNVDFHVLDIYNTEIDEDFKKVYFENNPYASASYLPHIYYYFRNFQYKVNLPGNFAASYWRGNRLNPQEITPQAIANFHFLGKFNFALKYFSEWLNNCQQLCDQYNIKIPTLNYWEERMTNWGAQTQLEKDIAQEDFNPFNSRLLVKLFISVEDKYTAKPKYLLQKEIIKILWPEMLKMPINPFFRNFFLGLQTKLRVYKLRK